MTMNYRMHSTVRERVSKAERPGLTTAG